MAAVANVKVHPSCNRGVEENTKGFVLYTHNNCICPLLKVHKVDEMELVLNPGILHTFPYCLLC